MPSGYPRKAQAKTSSSAKSQSKALVPAPDVQAEAASRIVTVQGQKVVLDSDLAEFYGVETYAVTRAVERNQARFPEDFVFRLTDEEVANLNHHFGGSSRWGGRRNNPRVFTEQGALSLAGVLKSNRADEVSVAVARAFVAMRDQLLALDEHPVLKQLISKVKQLEDGSKEQERFNRLIAECFGELRPILDAVKDQESPEG